MSRFKGNKKHWNRSAKSIIHRGSLPAAIKISHIDWRTAVKPWEESKEKLAWYRRAAAEALRKAYENPDFPIDVDPDLAEFMGAFEEADDDFSPPPETPR
jgi:hypothetical protein